MTRARDIQRVLVRTPNWIGDAVMSEPALSRVRALFPKATITLLAKPASAELFRHHPAVDRIILYDHRRRHAGLAGKWNLATEVRRGRFDTAILFPNAFEAALIVFLAGIPVRLGYATDGRSWLLTSAVRPPDTGSVHQVRYYLDLLEGYGRSSGPFEPCLFVTEREERAAERRLQETGIGRDEPIIGLNPGSVYGAAKRWLPERFAEAADRLTREQGGRVVIVGAPGEETLARRIADGMTARPVVLSGLTTVRELMAVIKRCRLFVTNDTGPMHIAAAFGVPVVAVFGPTDWRTTSPWGPHHVVVREPVECSPCLLRECPIDHRCMTGVTAERVFGSAVNLLASPASMQRSAVIAQRYPLKGVTVFLDRDGTLNRDTDYVKSPAALQLLPGAMEAVARLNRAGATVVLVTNQSGIARGLLTVDDLKAVHTCLLDALQAAGGALDAIYFCPHHPDEGCACRKPGTGMVERAVADLGVDLSRAYLVGDQLKDMELARTVGARSILVTTGPKAEAALALLTAEGRPPDRIATGLPEAVDWILEDAQQRGANGEWPMAGEPLSQSHGL